MTSSFSINFTAAGAAEEHGAAVPAPDEAAPEGVPAGHGTETASQPGERPEGTTAQQAGDGEQLRFGGLGRLEGRLQHGAATWQPPLGPHALAALLEPDLERERGEVEHGLWRHGAWKEMKRDEKLQTARN